LLAPVTRAARVVSFVWQHNMTRDARARSVILDLDTTIHALTERRGRDDAETVKLTDI